MDQVQDSLRFYYNLLAVKCHRVWIKFLLRFKIAISVASSQTNARDSSRQRRPVFINYKKAEDAIAYEDRFESPENLIALSKHPRRVDSSDADHFFKRTPEDRDNRIYLFVRKNKDDSEAKEFYFLGEIEAEGEPKPVKMPFDILDDKGKKTGTRLDDAFEISYHLDVPVREDIYDYLID